MKKNRKLFRKIFMTWLMMTLGASLFQTPVFAYSGEIELSSESVWQGVLEVLKAYGVHKKNVKKLTAESQWTYDSIRRERKIVPMKHSPELRNTYDRRYRLRIRLEPKGKSTLVNVRGWFQQRPLGEPVSTSWKTIKVSFEDAEVERQFFFQLLEKLRLIKESEELKKSPATKASSS